MALEATLVFDEKKGTEYRLLECSYEFSQSLDITGRPSDRPRGGIIKVAIVAPDDSDLIFHEWMFAKDLVKDGVIRFDVNKNSVFAPKKIRFKNAYCVGLREYFNDGNALPMYTEITIAAGQLLFGEGDDCVFRMID
ncbi:MAG: hypothetical protein J6Y98_05165 [Bacteroidales bacterium]|nr:hypothetical protein [Bacteroidales bacterium]